MNRQRQRIKTVTRTFRLDEQLHRMLEEEAAKEKITVNSLVSRMLWNYQKRCQYCLHYNLMLMEPTVLKAILEGMSDEALEEIALFLGPAFVKEHLARSGMTLNKESFEILLTDTLGQWTKWFDADVSTTGEGHVYYLHHVLGKKWSIFLKNLFEQAMKKLLSLNVPIETTENSVIFTMPNTARPYKPL